MIIRNRPLEVDTHGGGARAPSRRCRFGRFRRRFGNFRRRFGCFRRRFKAMSTSSQVDFARGCSFEAYERRLLHF